MNAQAIIKGQPAQRVLPVPQPMSLGWAARRPD